MEGPPTSTVGLQRVLARVRNPLWSTAALFIIVAGLQEAASVLVPVMVAIFMAIICSPAVSWLEKRRIPNVVAVLVVVAVIMAGLAGVGLIMGGSVSSFRESIPAYQARLESMATAVAGWLASKGLVLDQTQLRQVAEPGKIAAQAMNFVGASMNALASALSNTVLVVLTMILILMEGSTVPAKLRVMAGNEDADISHYRRIATDVQRYLGIKTVLSLATGLVVAIWAAILGVDFALLWGLLAFLLNYIPNIGSILAAVPAMLLALIQHGPGTSLALGAGYVVVNMVLGNVVEPMWMGRKLGLSTTVVFLSLVVWGWIWGPVGMLLSVPLTMVIKIMLGHSSEYAFIAKLLDSGTEPHDDEGAPPATTKPPERAPADDDPDDLGDPSSPPPPTAPSPPTR